MSDLQDELDPERPVSFGDFKTAAISAAGAISLAAAAALVAVSFLPDGAVKKVLESVAAAVFAIGLLQVLAEAWLQRKLTTEILREQRRIEARMLARLEERLDELTNAVHLDQRLRPSGVRAVERLGTDWRSFLSRANEIELLPVDLSAWLREEWVGVIEQARSRVLQVTVHLPNVNGMDPDNLSALEVRLGHGEARLQTDFGLAIDTIKQDWAEGRVAAGSRLTLHTYDRPAGFGLVLTEVDWALVLPPTAGPSRLAGRGLVALFEEGADPSYLEWARAQAGGLGSRWFDAVQA